MSTNFPLSSYSLVHSDRIELVRDRFLRTFGADRFVALPGAQRFFTTANYLQLPHVSLSYCSHRSAVELSFAKSGLLRQIFCIEGSGHFNTGTLSGEFKEGGWTPVFREATPLELTLGPRYQHIELHIEPLALRRHLGLLVEAPIDGDLTFDNDAYLGNPAVSFLRRRIFHSVFDLNLRGPLLSECVLGEIARELIVSFLLCHQHNFTHLLMKRPTAAAPSAIKAAEEFIETNWDKDLDLSTMAEIAGTSTRTLFRLFKRVRNCSPAEFVRRVRLQRAFELLSNPDREQSVTRVALRCGFQSTGHFASAYRQAFGERPSDTLTEARKRI